jgi:hypothetical protein
LKTKETKARDGILGTNNPTCKAGALTNRANRRPREVSAFQPSAFSKTKADGIPLKADR